MVMAGVNGKKNKILKNYKDSLKINNTEVLFLPYYELENITEIFI